MPDIVHPLVIHFAPVLWSLCLIAWIAVDLRQPKPTGPGTASGTGSEASPTTRILAMAAVGASLAALTSGLFDEDMARQMLQRGWELDNHRGAGIAATVVGIGAAATLLVPTRLANIRFVQAGVLLAVNAGTWIAVWLGHSALVHGIWPAH